MPPFYMANKKNSMFFGKKTAAPYFRFITTKMIRKPLYNILIIRMLCKVHNPQS